MQRLEVSGVVRLIYRSLGVKRLKAELNPICHLLALLGAHHILRVGRIRVKCWHTNVYTKPTDTQITVYFAPTAARELFVLCTQYAAYKRICHDLVRFGRSWCLAKRRVRMFSDSWSRRAETARSLQRRRTGQQACAISDSSPQQGDRRSPSWFEASAAT